MCGSRIPQYQSTLTAAQLAADTNNPYKNPGSGYSAPDWKPEAVKKEKEAIAAKKAAEKAAAEAAARAREEEEGRDRSSGSSGGVVAKNKRNKARKARQKSNRSRPKGAHGGASDIRLKENIKEIGLSPLGYKIYEFNYKGKDVRYRGAMAQDVITKLPQAISVKNGYFYVDYDMIDITMEVIE